MSVSDQLAYGRGARLRTVVSALASEVADSARGLVSTWGDPCAQGGEFVEVAARIAAEAKEMLEFAVAYERRRGTSWEVIGEAFGITRQAAHDRFAAAVARLEAEIIRCWVLGDDPRYPGLPYGAADTAEAAAILDRWAGRHLQDTDPLARRPGDDPERQHPVSRNLPVMDTLEMSALVLAATSMLSERTGVIPDDDPGGYARETAALELGLARRKVELYERMTAEATGSDHAGVSAVDLRDMLAGARARLAELEAASAPGTG